MIEVTLLNYLSGALDVPVYMELPPNPPQSCVVIEKIGSSMDNHLPSANFAIQSYGGTMFEAATLNEQVKQAVFDSVSLDEITAVSLNSDYHYTDTATKRYRYQAVFVITHY